MDYSFITDTLRFSNSSINNFEGCQMAFKLQYILAKSKVENFYSQFGSLVHLILEKYFGGDLEIFNLADYYRENFGKEITAAPPPFPKDLVSKYYEQGLEFFENFDWDRENEEVISVEDFIKYTVDGVDIVIKPDLLIRNKQSGEIILVDYKTSSIMKGKYMDKHKLEEYTRQLSLYAYILEKVNGIKINKLRLLFIRYLDKSVEVEYTTESGESVIQWFLAAVSKIKEERDWKPKQKLDYFCEQLCSVRLHCPLILAKYGIDTGEQDQYIPDGSK